MPNPLDYLVKPLIEYVREVELRTGHRPKIEVTLDTPIFLELAQWPLVRPGGDALAPIVILDDITIKPPDPDYVGTTFTYRDIDGKTLHSATVDASGRASVSIVDELREGAPALGESVAEPKYASSMADLADIGVEVFDRLASIAADMTPRGTWSDQPQHVRDGICILLSMVRNRATAEMQLLLRSTRIQLDALKERTDG